MARSKSSNRKQSSFVQSRKESTSATVKTVQAVAAQVPAPSKPQVVAESAPAKKSPNMTGLNAYRQLQARCKELGVKASGDTLTLEARIRRAEQGKSDASDYAKPKVEPQSFHGLSYREAQRLASFCKKQGYATDVRNCGWDKVRTILEAAMADGWTIADLQVEADPA